jgi:oxygen-dependent protoporphyrinogen oxidase
MAHVVVIGAGIAGAAAAYALREHRVTVVDGASRVGGKLQTSVIGDVDLDEGAEQFLVRVPEALDLVTALGLGHQVVHPRTTQAAVWSRGALRPLPARTVLGVPSSLRSLVEVLRPTEILRAAADLSMRGDVPDGDVAVGAYVRRRVGSAVVDRLVDPLLGGVYAGRADDLSMAATMAPLWAEQHRSSTQPSLLRAARAVVGAQHDEGAVFASLAGGLGQLVPATLAAADATVLVGRAVRRLDRIKDGFLVVHGPTSDEQALVADAVVVAVPATPASRLLSAVAPVASTELARIESASVAIVTLAYAPGATPRVGGSGFLVPAIEGRAVKAVTFSSQKWAHLDGETPVVRCSFGRAGDVVVLQRDDDDLARLAAAELHELAGLPVPVASRVSRWGGGLPQYAVGHVDRVARIRASVTDLPGLAVCGAAYDGVGVPACIRSAYAAAATLSAALASRRT